MNDELYLGIDNGTQGTKVAIFSRRQGRLLATASASHALITGPAGRREQDPAQWLAAAEQALRACLADPAVNPADIVAIGVSGQQHGCVPLDAAGQVIRPAKLWCDTETTAECDLLTEALGGRDAVIARIGNAIAAGFTASKVLWLRRHEPDHYARLATLLLPHDYLNFWLTGERVTECGDASGTAYFDVRRRAWSPEVLRAIDPSGRLEGCLPRLLAADEPAGRLRPELAARFGLPAGVRVSAGGGDNMMAAIGTGNVAPGIVTCSLGTSGTIYACSREPVIDPAGELAAFCSSSGEWLPLVCTMNVTVATETTRALLELGLADFDRQAAAAQPGAGGLVMLPFFNGERTPALPNARALLAGMSADNTTRANLCRAAMEGATFGLRYGLDVLRRQGIAPKEIRLVGGGARSAIWRRLAADILGCPIVCPECTEAGVMGCVLQAMWCRDRQAGKGTTLAALAAEQIRLDPASRVAPGPDAVRYDALYARYLELERVTRNTYSRESLMR